MFRREEEGGVKFSTTNQQYQQQVSQQQHCHNFSFFPSFCSISLFLSRSYELSGQSPTTRRGKKTYFHKAIYPILICSFFCLRTLPGASESRFGLIDSSGAWCTLSLWSGATPAFYFRAFPRSVSLFPPIIPNHFFSLVPFCNRLLRPTTTTFPLSPTKRRYYMPTTRANEGDDVQRKNAVGSVERKVPVRPGFELSDDEQHI